MSGMPRTLPLPHHWAPTATSGPSPTRCTILPPYLLTRLAQVSDPRVADVAQHTLGTDLGVRDRRTVLGARAGRKDPGLVPPELVRRAKGLDAGRRHEVTAVLLSLIHI